jgi:Pin2-interacting protein X1
MAASNSTALAEILGIPSSSSSSSSPAAFAASPSPLPTTTTTEEAQDSLQKLTTASQSVGDYFKAKLGAKAQQQQPRLTLAPTSTAENSDDYTSRAGLGASRSLPTETTSSDEQARGGIGVSSKFAAMFALGQDTREGNNMASVDIVAMRDVDDCNDEDDRRKNEKKRAKEERRKEKEEQRRRRAEAKRGTAAAGSPYYGEVLDVHVGETPDRGTKRKKHYREAEAVDSRLEGVPSGSGMEDIPTKKRKKRDKDRQAGEQRELEK